jgi:hypothetical protein
MWRRQEWKTIIHFGTEMIEGKIRYCTTTEYHAHVCALWLMDRNRILVITIVVVTLTDVVADYLLLLLLLLCHASQIRQIVAGPTGAITGGIAQGYRGPHHAFFQFRHCSVHASWKQVHHCLARQYHSNAH